MKIAIVHDWLVTYAGSERVLEQMLDLFPEADLFAVADFVQEEQRAFLRQRKATTTFIQKLPFAARYYRHYLPLMPVAIEQLDLSAYDVILSSSHAVAKGVLTGPDQIHICYIHSPIRYAWDLQHRYLKESGLRSGVKSAFVRWLLHRIRLWDYRTQASVDYFVANSAFIAGRVWKTYRRKAAVIHPPVDTRSFRCVARKEDYYLAASRFVPYKKMEMIIEAFGRMPDKRLVVIGDGPDFRKAKAGAKANVTLLGYQPSDVMRDYMQRAKAFVFAAEEDFGIIPVEAQACGTPVIAYGKGGALETIRGLEDPYPTGVFFHEQTPESLIDAVGLFEAHRNRFSPILCSNNAKRFGKEVFRREFSAFVSRAIAESSGHERMSRKIYTQEWGS